MPGIPRPKKQGTSSPISHPLRAVYCSKNVRKKFDSGEAHRRRTGLRYGKWRYSTQTGLGNPDAGINQLLERERKFKLVQIRLCREKLANGAFITCIFFSVNMFFIRGVLTYLFLVLVFGCEKMVCSPQQPKHRIDTDKRPGGDDLSWLFYFYH